MREAWGGEKTFYNIFTVNQPILGTEPNILPQVPLSDMSDQSYRSDKNLCSNTILQKKVYFGTLLPCWQHFFEGHLKSNYLPINQLQKLQHSTLLKLCEVHFTLCWCVLSGCRLLLILPAVGCFRTSFSASLLRGGLALLPAG